MCTYSHRFFRTAIIAAPLLLWLFGCNTIDNSMNPPPESKMAKSSKKADPVKIMCLGNSLTWGEDGNNRKKKSKIFGYRKTLYENLQNWKNKNKLDINFEFVGSDKDGKEKYNIYQGRQGVSIKWINENVLDKTLNKNKPDIILLHVGHNPTPARTAKDWESRAVDLKKMLDKIDTWEGKNKTVHVILAKIVSMTTNNRFHKDKNPDNVYPYNWESLMAYNGKVHDLYLERRNNDKIYLVDMSDDFDFSAKECLFERVEKGKDGCHPSDKGYEQMAEIWFNELKNVIEDNFPARSKRSKSQSPVKSGGGGTTEIKIEAEDKACSWIRGTSVDNNNRGYTGKGFVNTPNHTGAWTQCKVKVPDAGSYSIKVQYANGSSGRAAQLIVNGKAKATGAFASTGNWAKWDGEIFRDISLKTGTNTIRLSANTPGGLGNIDYFSYEFSGKGSNKNSKNIVVNFKNNYDIPCKIDPIYINGSGDNITLPDQKCDGWKLTSFYVPGKGSRNPGDKVFINKSMTVIAEWLEMDEDQSSGKKVDNTKINIEAEDKACSWIRGTSIDNNHRGYTGKGFVNTPNHTRAWMQCEVKVKTAGPYRIKVRYANGSSGRAAQLIVNGKAKATGAFASTGNWGKWDDEIFTNIPVRAGTNTVRLSANTGGGLGNIDHFDFSR